MNFHEKVGKISGLIKILNEKKLLTLREHSYVNSLLHLQQSLHLQDSFHHHQQLQLSRLLLLHHQL